MVCVPGRKHDTWVPGGKIGFAKSVRTKYFCQEKYTLALEDLMLEINTQRRDWWL